MSGFAPVVDERPQVSRPRCRYPALPGKLRPCPIRTRRSPTNGSARGHAHVVARPPLHPLSLRARGRPTLLPDDLTIDTWFDADGIQRAWVALVPSRWWSARPVGCGCRSSARFPKPTCAPTSGARWHAGSLVLFARSGWVACLANGTRDGLPLLGPICRLTPGAGRPTACGVTTPPVGGPAAARPTGTAVPSQCRPHGTRIADGDVSDFERFPRHAGGSIPAFRAWTRRERSPSMPPSITDARPLSRRTPRTRRRTPRRCRPRADR